MIPLIAVAAVLLLNFAWPHTFHELKDLVLTVIGGCSTLHTFLPPWDWEPDFLTTGLADFPNAQKMWRRFFGNRWYKLMIYTIGYLAINARSAIWKNSISMSVQFSKMKPGNL